MEKGGPTKDGWTTSEGTRKTDYKMTEDMARVCGT